MRTDHLKRHMKQHEDTKLDKVLSGEARSDETSLNTDFTSSMERGKIIKKLWKDNEEYKEKLERGKILYEEVNQQGIQEESLCQEYKALLDIYRKQKKNIDIENVTLRSWQESLLKYMKPSDREMIWVIDPLETVSYFKYCIIDSPMLWAKDLHWLQTMYSIVIF